MTEFAAGESLAARVAALDARWQLTELGAQAPAACSAAEWAQLAPALRAWPALCAELSASAELSARVLASAEQLEVQLLLPQANGRAERSLAELRLLAAARARASAAVHAWASALRALHAGGAALQWVQDAQGAIWAQLLLARSARAQLLWFSQAEKPYAARAREVLRIDPQGDGCAVRFADDERSVALAAAPRLAAGQLRPLGAWAAALSGFRYVALGDNGQHAWLLEGAQRLPENPPS